MPGFRLVLSVTCPRKPGGSFTWKIGESAGVAAGTDVIWAVKPWAVVMSILSGGQAF